MAQKANQSNVWDFSVAQRQLQDPVSGKLTPFWGNVREDTGECLGVTTEQYGLLQHRELVVAARQALEVRGMTDYKENIVVTGGGAKLFATFEFRERQLASKVGDIFGYRLTLKNSLDRSTRAAFLLGFLRLACLNGAASLEKEFAVTKRHSLDISVDFLGDAIETAVQRGPSALKIYEVMAQATVTDEQGINLFDNLVAKGHLSKVLADSMKVLWLSPRREADRGRNVYNVYNAITEHLTHAVAAERFEYADKLTNGLLFILANAARQADRLAELILPVAVPPVQSVVIDI